MLSPFKTRLKLLGFNYGISASLTKTKEPDFLGFNLRKGGVENGESSWIFIRASSKF